ncbi:MAG TPA: hypothetical protein VFW48_00375 [Solirubrobacterales bacterium]|nr:hypothetical protein [Solirubrobacterales bacterium]
MALIAYMPTAACAVPGRAGRLPEPAGEPIFSDRAGLEVRARQLVYGERPVAGAKAGAAAARRGAGRLAVIGEAHAPRWASLPAKAYETDPGPAP